MTDRDLLALVVVLMSPALIAWLELRVLPLFRRELAERRAVSKKVGVTEEDVARELRAIEGKEAA